MQRLGLWNHFLYLPLSLRSCFFRLLILLLPFFCSGCQRHYLACRTEFLSPLYLASEQIDTPDPARISFFGQQIRIKWNLPKTTPAELLVHLRFGTREIQTIRVPIYRHMGFWTYRLANEDYSRLCGIVSYKVDLFQDGMLLDVWRHHLWADIIEITGN